MRTGRQVDARTVQRRIGRALKFVARYDSVLLRDRNEPLIEQSVKVHAETQSILRMVTAVVYEGLNVSSLSNSTTLSEVTLHRCP